MFTAPVGAKIIYLNLTLHLLLFPLFDQILLLGFYSFLSIFIVIYSIFLSNERVKTAAYLQT